MFSTCSLNVLLNHRNEYVLTFLCHMYNHRMYTTCIYIWQKTTNLHAIQQKTRWMRWAAENCINPSVCTIRMNNIWRSEKMKVTVGDWKTYNWTCGGSLLTPAIINFLEKAEHSVGSHHAQRTRVDRNFKSWGWLVAAVEFIRRSWFAQWVHT